MNRLKKELVHRNIIGDNEMDIIRGLSSIEWNANYVSLQNNLIIIACFTNVLDPVFILYDKNFHKVAEQCIWLNNMTHWNPDGQKNPWDSHVYSTKDYANVETNC
jgi:hypothetical protein